MRALVSVPGMSLRPSTTTENMGEIYTEIAGLAALLRI